MSERLSRAFDFRVENTETRDDGLTLEGYAAVFDSPSQITDRLGTYMETIARGAFTKTLSERTPLMQFDHGSHPMIGSIPLGTVKLAREDEQGLFVRARLSDNWLIQPVRDAIADGAIRGMSFQFEVLRDDWNDDKTERTIREIKLYELGPVVWPAYPQTTVGVRSELIDLLSCDDLRAELAHALYAPQAHESVTQGTDVPILAKAGEHVTRRPDNTVVSVDAHELARTIFTSLNAATSTSGEEPDEPPLALVDKKTVAKMLRKAQMAGRSHPLLEETDDVQEIA